MKYYVSVFTIFVALKSVYSSITSNLSLCTKPDLSSGECLKTNVEAALKDLENCNSNLGVNVFDSYTSNAVQVEPSSGPLSFEQMITLQLREHSCAKATEYINENNCKEFGKGETVDYNQKGNKNNTRPIDADRDNSLATTAIYLYGWLAYRLVFIFLKEL